MAGEPIDAKMKGVAEAINVFFNGGGPEPHRGFMLIVFEAQNIGEGEVHYVSSGIGREDAIALYKEMIARLEGTLHEGGRA